MSVETPSLEALQAENEGLLQLVHTMEEYYKELEVRRGAGRACPHTGLMASLRLFCIDRRGLAGMATRSPCSLRHQ